MPLARFLRNSHNKELLLVFALHSAVAYFNDAERGSGNCECACGCGSIWGPPGMKV